ncbi:MAG TPA: hypothetical protein VOB72_26270 [Candidatus Dormibacteraeota bacterium]|nr:hypothetical protein [Candidatus Dormibacteraeota bacterium]
MEKIQVNFLHPRTSATYQALLHPQCTAELALQRLQSQDTGPFLEPAPASRPYVLVVASSDQELTPNTTMAAAGVQPGEHLEVRQRAQGAGR